MIYFEMSQSNFTSLRSLCWPFFFQDELCVFHGCEALLQHIPRAGCKSLFCSKHTSGFLVTFEKPHLKPDLDTPRCLLFSRGLMFLGLSLVRTCFLRGGFCFQVLYPFVHRAQILMLPSITPRSL